MIAGRFLSLLYHTYCNFVRAVFLFNRKDIKDAKDFFLLIYYFFQIFSINIMGRYDKQFGRSSASLFICRVCLSANIALLYVLFHFVAKARKKLFSQIDSLSALADTMDEKFPYRTEPKGSDICCKKFLWREKY